MFFFIPKGHFIDVQIYGNFGGKNLKNNRLKYKRTFQKNKTDLQTFVTNNQTYFLFIFFMCEYYLYVCKFQSKRPYFTYLIVSIKNNRETEYYIAKKHD